MSNLKYVKTILCLVLGSFLLMNSSTLRAGETNQPSDSFVLVSQYHILVASNDSDNDGIPNSEDDDDDNDGIKDSQDEDHDGDGYTDAEEVAAGSDPDDEDSVPPADTTPPVLTVPANITIEATAILTPVSLGTASATDNIDGTVPVSNNAPATFPLGVTRITYTATDTAGNTATATQTVTVVDATAPVLSVPTSITTEATGSQTSVTLGTATATDIFGATVTNDAPATFPVGVTTVTYTATDGNGLTSTGTQTVTVTDTIAPTITVPANITVEATAALTTVNLGVASAADLVDGVVSVANDAPVSFLVGTTTVTYTATDTAGNIATATQTVTVTDTTPPVLSLIGATAITVEAGSVYTNAGATAVDLVDGNISSLISVTGTVDTNILGSYTLAYQVSDASGNAAVSLSRTITVVDTTPPAITASAAVSATSGDNLPIAVNIGIAIATDLFTVTITHDAPVTFPVGTTVVTWTATDANGNATTATQLVTVTLVDITPPTVTAPANITLEATNALTTVNLGIASAADIVDGTLPVTSNAPTAFPVGTTIVIYSATDAAGNTGTATQ